MRKFFALFALFALLLPSAIPACAEDMTFSGFTLALPEEYASVPNSDSYASDDLYLTFYQLAFDDWSTAEQLDYLYSYAEDFRPQAEMVLIQTTPFVALIFKNIDENGTGFLFLTQPTDLLAILMTPTSSAVTQSTVERAARSLVRNAAIAAQDGYAYTQALRYGNITLNIPSTFARTGDALQYTSPDGDCEIEIIGYRSTEMPLYTSEQGRDELLKDFLYADDDDELPEVQRFTVADGTAAILLLDVDNYLSYSTVIVCRQKELFYFSVTAYGEDCHDRCVALTDGLLAHISAPADEGLLQNAMAFTQPVQYGPFTFYIPAHFVQFDTGVYSDATMYGMRAGVIFEKAGAYAYDLFDSAQEQREACEKLLASDSSIRAILSELPDATAAIVQAGECSAISIHFNKADGGLQNLLFFPDRRDVFDALLFAYGDDCEQTLAELTDGFLANTVYNATP